MVNVSVPGAIRDRVKAFTRLPARDLVPHPQNWRRHPEAQLVAMRGVLERIGFAGVCLVRELGDGRYQLLDGHLRQETVPDMLVPAVILDLDEHEAQELLLTYDPIASLAQQDSRELAALLADLDARGDLDVARLVWPDYVIDPLLAADWLPSGKGSLGGEHPPSAWHHTLVLNPTQHAVIDEAITRVRTEVGDRTLSPGDCLVRVCESYLGRAAA